MLQGFAFHPKLNSPSLEAKLLGFTCSLSIGKTIFLASELWVGGWGSLRVEVFLPNDLPVYKNKYLISFCLPLVNLPES